MRDTRACAMHGCSGEKILGEKRANLTFIPSVTYFLDHSKEISRSLWTCFSIWFSSFALWGIIYL